MKKNSGIIYDMGDGRYGLAKHSEQHESFHRIKKVYLHIFLDPLCTQPELEPGTGKKYVTLKAVDKLKIIGYAD